MPSAPLRPSSFQEPDCVEYGVAPLWFWNDKLDEQELRRQVRMMASAGVRNFVMHARWGLETPYLSKEWWKMVAATVDEAKRVGSRAWVYDEYAYPSGIGGFKLTRRQALRERYLAVTKAVSNAGAVLELATPVGALVSACAYPVRDGKLDPTRLVKLGKPKAGRWQWTPPTRETWKAFAFAMQVEPFKGVGRYSPNYLSPQLGREFVKLTHEAYWSRFKEHFGKTIPTFFLDEPRFGNPLPWDERFAASFAKERGYDLRPKLALLLEDGGSSTARVRRDYYSHMADLYCRHFFRPVGEWCRKHGVEHTGHMMAEETLGGQTRYTGQGMKPYKHFSIPGTDFLGKGIGGLAPKMASSAAYVQGASRVSSETFAGCGWDFTAEEMIGITGWLYSQGINLMVPHAFFYSTRTDQMRNDWPPSMFFQWHDWKRYPVYAKAVARLSQALSGGHIAADVALYHPAEAFQAAYVPDLNFKTGYFKKGPRLTKPAQAMEAAFQRVAHGLSGRHRDYVILGDEGLHKLNDFKVLVLTEASHLSRVAAKRIVAFKKQGGKVLVVGKAATDSFEKVGDPAISQALRGSVQVPAADLGKAWRALEKFLKVPDIELKGPKSLAPKVLELYDVIHDPYLHQDLESMLKKGKGGVWAMHYRKPGEDLYFFASMLTKPVTFKARLRCVAPRVELRWPANGYVRAAKARRIGRSLTEVAITLPPLQSVLVAFQK